MTTYSWDSVFIASCMLGSLLFGALLMALIEYGVDIYKEAREAKYYSGRKVSQRRATDNEREYK